MRYTKRFCPFGRYVKEKEKKENQCLLPITVNNSKKKEEATIKMSDPATWFLLFHPLD